MALVAAASLGAGCTQVERLSIPAPNTRVTAPPVTSPPATLPDTSGVILPTVPGATTTTAPVATGGTATISGAVTGPAGPVRGATVQAERIVGGQEAVVDATTTADGAFSLAGLVGGDYRVRAWMAPGLDLVDPQIFYLGAGEDHTLRLPLSSFAGVTVVGVINPDPPTLGQAANLAVQVTGETVGPDGVVRDPAVAGAQVELTNGPGWLAHNGNPLTTAADGEAIFEVSCVSVGDQPLDASVNGQAPEALDVPSCQPAPVPTTTTPPPTTPPPPTTTTPPPTTATTPPPTTATTPPPTTPPPPTTTTPPAVGGTGSSTTSAVSSVPPPTPRPPPAGG